MPVKNALWHSNSCILQGPRAEATNPTDLKVTLEYFFTSPIRIFMVSSLCAAEVAFPHLI